MGRDGGEAMTDQGALFDLPDADGPESGAPQIRYMRGAYGRKAGQQCWTCEHFMSKAFDSGRLCYKCARYGSTSGKGSDWHRRWQACGLWKAKERP